MAATPWCVCVCVCVGAVLEELVAQTLDAHKCSFAPRHVRNLANEFCCYANYKTGLDCYKSEHT